MSIEQVRDFVSEKSAKLVSYEDNELLFRRTLVRNWPAERDKLIEDALTYLYTYGSAGNLTASQSVTDPVADRHEYTGVWRVAKNEKVSADNEAQWPGITGVVQTLRLGFAETLAWDEARIVSNEIVPGNDSEVEDTVAGHIDPLPDSTSDDPSDVMIVEWVNLNPTTVRAAASGGIIGGDTVTDPVIRGVTMTGLWHKVAITIGESSLEDGSAIVRVVLARPQYILNAYESYFEFSATNFKKDAVHYLWNVPRDIAQTIIDDWEGAGRSARASLNSTHTVNIVLRGIEQGTSPFGLLGVTSAGNCASTSVTDYYWGVTNPKADAYKINSAGGDYAPTIGVSYTRSDSFNSREGTFDITIRTSTTAVRIGTAYADIEIAEGHLIDATESHEFGLISKPSLPDDPPVGTRYEGNVGVNDDCSFNSKVRKIVSTPIVEIISWGSENGTVWDGKFQNWAGETGPPAYTADAEGALAKFLFDTGISPVAYRVNVGFSYNDDGTLTVNISANPTSNSGSIPPGGGGEEYENFVYINPRVKEFKVAPYNDGEPAEIFYKLEYWIMAVEYYQVGSTVPDTDPPAPEPTYRDEKFIYQQIVGSGSAARGWSGKVTRVGEYWRLEMVIGRIYDADLQEGRSSQEGIGSRLGEVPVSNPVYTAPPS